MLIYLSLIGIFFFVIINFCDEWTNVLCFLWILVSQNEWEFLWKLRQVIMPAWCNYVNDRNKVNPLLRISLTTNWVTASARLSIITSLQTLLNEPCRDQFIDIHCASVDTDFIAYATGGFRSVWKEGRHFLPVVHVVLVFSPRNLISGIRHILKRALLIMAPPPITF